MNLLCLISEIFNPKSEVTISFLSFILNLGNEKFANQLVFESFKESRSNEKEPSNAIKVVKISEAERSSVLSNETDEPPKELDNIKVSSVPALTTLESA